MYEIDMIKNIRELLKNTIFAHPDDVMQSDEMSKAVTKTKGKTKK